MDNEKKKSSNTLSDTFHWFELAHPAPTSKQLHTQTGVHFEEVAEMLEEMKGTDRLTSVLIHSAMTALTVLGDHLKRGDNLFTIPDRKLFLDALCDQIVTATGVGRDCHFPMVAALTEVNASNWSKFVDGKPIFNEQGKIMKGPNYFKPDLSAFVPN